MRIDATNARTWLVAAVAAWALLFAVLALAGMAGRIGTLEAEATGSAARPAALDVPPAPPMSAFGEIAARPLFTGDRRPQPFFIDPQDEGEGSGNGFDFVLTSVLRTPDFAMAILQPAEGGESIRLKVGEGPPGASNWQLDSVDARSVVFATPEGPRTLELRVFDGSGGQPPTPMTPMTPTPSPDGRPPAQAASRPPPTPEQAAQAASQAADAAERAAAANAGPQSRDRARRGDAQTQSATGSATAETAPSAGPSEAQVEAIRRRIEERRARLRQQQQQQQSIPQTP